MPAVTDWMHSELGAIARKQRETRAELRSLQGRTDPGAVQRTNALRVHLDKLQAKEQNLTEKIEFQERVQRANGLREEQQSLAQLLRGQGIRVDTSHIGAATRDDDGGGLVATDIAFEGGADETNSAIARATTKPNVPNVNVNADVFDVDVFALASPELRSRALSAVEHQAVRQDVPVPESGAERLQDALRAAEDHTPDLDVLARYLLVTGSPHYEKAFAKVIRGSRDNSGP